MKILRVLMWAGLGAACAAQLACAAGPVYVTPEEAAESDDFAIQGEYAGTVRTEDGDQKVGVQVVALGDGKFRAVGYEGGLPGAGWDGGERQSAEASVDESGNVVFAHPDKDVAGVLEASEGKMRVTTGDGQEVGLLEKVNRESPTLGAEPPDGAIVLFDGAGTDAWEKGQMSENGLLMQGATSKEQFEDHVIHVEFRLPFQPNDRGQKRGNSGLYVQNRYEVQMLDSFGLDGQANECGGLYSYRKPDVNMCFPPLAWQTFDIDFTAPKFDDDGNLVSKARITVKHNGVVIHDNVEVQPGDQKGAGPLHLQDHGNPVRYRNIWVKEK